MKWVTEHRKAIVALVGSLATFAAAVGLDKYEWVAAVIAVLSALGVYQVRNGTAPVVQITENTHPPVTSTGSGSG